MPSRPRFQPRVTELESRLAPATFRVDPNAMDGAANSLRAAIIAANATPAADTIIIGAGTVSLSLDGSGEDFAASGDLDIRAPLTITGAGMNLTTIDASAINDRVFQVFGSSVTFNDMTITGGVADLGGGIMVKGGSVTLNRVDVTGNSAVGNAGMTGGFGAGGGIYFSGGALTLNSTLLENNSAVGGLALGTLPDVTTNFKSPDLRGSAVIVRGGHGQRGGDGMGGGLYAAAGTVRFNSGLIQGNQAIGGLGADGDEAISITSTLKFGGNMNLTLDSQPGGGRGGDGLGGGIYAGVGGVILGPQVYVIDNQAIGGTGGTGGRTVTNVILDNQGGNATITINDGKAATGGRGGDGRGGGLAFSGSAVRLNTSTLVANNTAIGGQGGRGASQIDAVINIAVTAVNTATSTVNVFPIGQANGGQGGDGLGGGIYNWKPALQPTIAVFARNQALGGGGGDPGSVQTQNYVVNTTLNNNVFKPGSNLTNNINVPIDPGDAEIGLGGNGFGGGAYFFGAGMKPRLNLWLNSAQTNGNDVWQG